MAETNFAGLGSNWKKNRGAIRDINFFIEQFSRARNDPKYLWFCFTPSFDWLRKLVPSCQPIRFITDTNRDLVSFGFFYFEISVVARDILL